MVEESIEKIRCFLRGRGRTKKMLGERAGVHPNTLLGVEESSWNPTAETLRKLETAIIAIEAGDQEAA